MLRTASVSMNTSNIRRRFSTWRKSSLISKIHQNDHQTVQPPTADRPLNVVNVNAVRGMTYACVLPSLEFHRLKCEIILYSVFISFMRYPHSPLKWSGSMWNNPSDAMKTFLQTSLDFGGRIYRLICEDGSNHLSKAAIQLLIISGLISLRTLRLLRPL